jgi:hypothetical protein
VCRDLPGMLGKLPQDGGVTAHGDIK